MLTQEEKAERYDIIEHGIKQKAEDIIFNLCKTLKCKIQNISQEELEATFDEEMKFYFEEVFLNQENTFFLLDCMISECAPVKLSMKNPYKKRILN